MDIAWMLMHFASQINENAINVNLYLKIITQNPGTEKQREIFRTKN